MPPDSQRTALFLTPEAPYPATGGGSIRTASLLEYLAPRYAVDVIVFREPGAPDPAAAFPPGRARDVRVIELPYHSKRTVARAGRNLARFILGRPPLNDRFAGFEARIARCLGGRGYDLAVVEHFWCAPYCEQLAPHAKRLVLDLHNVESVFYDRCAGAEAWPASIMLRRFAQSCRRMERRWLARFSALLVASDDDAARVRRIAPGSQAFVFPNAIPAAPQPDVAEENVLIFSGNLEYQPNVSAVRFFRNEIWPRLREGRPGLVWRIIGRNPRGVARYAAGDPRIELRGPVEDAIEALAAARVVVVPLLAGSGTRIKILEAWAAGRAVVSTRIGAEGLPAAAGEHLLLADTPRDFAEAVSGLLDSPAERARLGRAGRALYERRFTWPRAWEILERIGI